jgi:hypothetical protein
VYPNTAFICRFVFLPSPPRFAISQSASTAQHTVSMNTSAGFDMVPRLTKREEVTTMWQNFLDRVQETYKHDDEMEFKARYIDFKAGEHLQLLMEGHKFLRFSSKISGRDGGRAEKYIRDVARLASEFGSRIHFWSEKNNQLGFYRWEEVDESLRTYEQVSSLPDVRRT